MQLLYRISIDERRIFMIAEEMLRKAAARSCESYVAMIHKLRMSLLRKIFRSLRFDIQVTSHMG